MQGVIFLRQGKSQPDLFNTKLNTFLTFLKHQIYYRLENVQFLVEEMVNSTRNLMNTSCKFLLRRNTVVLPSPTSEVALTVKTQRENLKDYLTLALRILAVSCRNLSTDV